MSSLGPWQGGYDAWSELDDYIRTLHADHFQTTLLTQILEVREQLALGDLEHAAKEMNDIISVTLNWMRAIGLDSAGIAATARARGKLRYAGQVKEIMARYQKKYGI